MDFFTDYVILDIEVLPNYFLVGMLGKDGNYSFFESYEKDIDISSLKKFIKSFKNKDTMLIGHNLVGYDLVVLDRIFKRKKTISPLECREISNSIINASSDEFIYFNRKVWGKVLDTKTFTNKSLKVCAISLDSQDIEEVNVNDFLSKENVEKLRYYNLSDLKNTLLVASRLESQFTIRAELEKKIDNSSVWHTSPSTIAMKVININRENHVLRQSIAVRDIITKRIFSDPILSDFQMRLLKKTYPEDPCNEIIHIDDLEIVFASGGLHGFQGTGILDEISNEDELLYELDFTSFYPNLMIALEVYPVGVEKEIFLGKLKNMTAERIQAKKSGDKTKANSLKLIINSIFGQLGNKKGRLYDPFSMIKVTFNGQLILLELFDLIKSHCKCLMLNTDGILVKVSKEEEDVILEIAREFGQKINIPIESTPIKKIYAPSINDYVAIKEDGSTKLKGRFSDPAKSFSLSKYPEACRLSAIEHICSGFSIEDFIKKQPPINFLYKERRSNCLFIDDLETERKTIRYTVPLVGGVTISSKNINGSIVNTQPKDRLKEPIYDLNQIKSIDYDHYISVTDTILSDQKGSTHFSVLNTLVSICPKLRNPKIIKNTRLKTILKMIKENDLLKKKISRIRDGKIDEKKSLPQVIPQGLFNSRSKKGLISFTGLFSIDIDGKIDDKKHLLDIKKIIFDSFNWVVSIFISPSGLGLKVIGLSNIPKDTPSYISMLKTAHELIKPILSQSSLYLDESLDISKGFFLSHDPDLHVNDSPKRLHCHVSVDSNDHEPPISPPLISLTDKTPEKVFDECMRLASHLKNAIPGDKFEKRRKLAKLAGGYHEGGLLNDGEIDDIEAIVISSSNHPNDAKKEWDDCLKHGKKYPISMKICDPSTEKKEIHKSLDSEYVPQDLDEIGSWENTLKKGYIKTNLKSLDVPFIINKEDLIIISAESNHGKTTFMHQLLYQFLKQNVRCLFVSYEGNRIKSYIRLRTMLNFFEKSPNETYSDMKDSFRVTSKLSLEDIEKLTVDDYDVIFIDYIQIMKASTKDVGWLGIKELSYRLLTLCEKTGIVIICGSQVNMNGETREGKDIYNASSTVLRLFNHSHKNVKHSTHKKKFYLDSGIKGHHIMSMFVEKSRIGECEDLERKFILKDGVFIERNQVEIDSDSIDKNFF